MWIDQFFSDEVWPKVAVAQCLKCHKQAGDAEDTRFILSDLGPSSEAERAETMRQNRDAFVCMAMASAEQEPLLLVANDVACRNVALDFSRTPDRRILFPRIKTDILPGVSPESDEQIRQAIVYLHQRVLGRYDEIDSPEVDRTFELFAGVVADANARGGFEPQEIWSCRQGLEQPVLDPHYTVRAWRAVVTYLLRQQEFLYE
jgi:hypothetical protein